jgi:hypothetical protein
MTSCELDEHEMKCEREYDENLRDIGDECDKHGRTDPFESFEWL